MATILENVSRMISSKPKTVYQKMKLLHDLILAQEKRYKRRFDDFFDFMHRNPNVGEGKKYKDFFDLKTSGEYAEKRAGVLESENGLNDLKREAIKANEDGYRGFNSWNGGPCWEGTRAKLAKRYKVNGSYNTLPTCDEIFLKGAFLPSMRGIDKKVALDPLAYVDHPSKIIRDYARSLITGDLP